jgi:hypothetical protein
MQWTWRYEIIFMYPNISFFLNKLLWQRWFWSLCTKCLVDVVDSSFKCLCDPCGSKGFRRVDPVHKPSASAGPLVYCNEYHHLYRSSLLVSNQGSRILGYLKEIMILLCYHFQHIAKSSTICLSNQTTTKFPTMI